MSWVHVVSFCNLIGTARVEMPEVDNSSSGCYQALSSPSPHSKERVWDGNETIKISTEESSLYVCPAAFRSPRSTC